MATKEGREGMDDIRIHNKRGGNKSCPLSNSSPLPPGSRPPTLLMQLLDGDKSLHQLWKGGGDGAPALYGVV